MKNVYLITILLLFQGSLVFSQVAINENGNTADPSAGLDINYSNKGLLIPRLSFEQRNSIPNPAQGLIIYCTDCSADGKGVMSIYEGTGWKTMELRCDAPGIPVAGNLVSTINQITWDWDAAPIAVGYRIGLTNDFESATELGSVTTYSESNLECNTEYTRYVWAYNQCGYSAPLVLQKSTQQIPMSGAPLAGTHSATVTTITWNWSSVDGASGYKWNTVNDFNSAFDMGPATTSTETGLVCGTAYTRYAWAYNECGISQSVALSHTTSSQAAESPLAASHIPDSYSIIWTWHPVNEAAGYRWNTSNDYASSILVGADTSYAETNLECSSQFTRYIWAFNTCGVSNAVAVIASTTGNVHPAPTPAVSIPSSHEVTWNWHPLDDHFSNFKWNTTNNYYTAIDLLTDTTYTETGLSCNTSYTRYIWGYDNCAVSSVVILSSTTALFPPANPSSGTHVPTAVQIEWQWNAVADATGYKWGTTNNAGTATDLGNVTSFVESGLTCNTNYIRYIWAYSNCGVSVATSLSQTTALDPPVAPQAAAHEAYPTLIIWNWNPVAGVQGYKWGTTSNYSEAMEMGASTSKIETGLTCNTNYTRYIWAYGDCGVSEATALVQTSGINPPPDPMTGTHVPSAFQIVWNWNGTGATGYKWNTTNDFGSAQDMGMSTSMTETGLLCNTSYTRYVWAYSPCGNSAAISLVQSTSLNPPPAPIAATHTPSPFQVIWAWNPVSGATGYKWGTTNNESLATDIGLTTTYTETGLSCNTPYMRYVWAYSSCGISNPATLNQATSLNPPAAPDAGTHVATHNQVTWNWSAVSGATSYKWNTTNNPATAIDIGNNTSRIETGLNCNTSYTRYAWAVSSCGTSTATSLTQTTTIQTPPAPVTATHVPSNTQVIWNWNAVSGATGYRWNTTNDYATSINVNAATTYTENNLTCGTSYTRYIWAYNNCANSVSASLTTTTATNPPGNPVAGTHSPSGAQIIWNWTAASGATSYKWNTTDDIATATDIGNVTSRTETGLNCSTAYTRYLWASNGCSNSSSVSLSSTTTSSPPATPGSGTHTSTASQIVWNWTTVPDAAGYKFNTVNIYSSATDLGAASSYVENGLACNTTFTRFVWAYSSCGVSTSVPLTHTTSSDPPASPAEGTHVATPEQITWNWNTVSGAIGYKWNTTNDYATAIDNGTSTTKVETGVNCGTSYTRYVWAYHSCGTSTSTTLTQTSGACFVCGTSIVITHIAGSVAPVDKTTTYGTVTDVPGATSKCWITSNLGSDHQATAVTDATEESAGWYWQFNRTQGYKHDGTTRTPNTTWITYIEEPNGWLPANDPCTIELGTGWRLPTIAEWQAVDAGGSWSNWNGPWNSLLKMHAAGDLASGTGALEFRGNSNGKGYYWSNSNSTYNHMGMALYFSSSASSTSMYNKSNGYSIRCLRD